MKGGQYFIVLLVLSASLMRTSEAARSRTSNQNSFRRAANGIYQTLSSVFGEEKIKGLYKVKTGARLSQLYSHPRVGRSSWLMAEGKLAGSGPTVNRTDAILVLLQTMHRRGSFQHGGPISAI